MKKKSNNYAFIDSQNLNLSIRSLLRFMNNLRNKLEYKKKKPPMRTEPHQGLFRKY